MRSLVSTLSGETYPFESLQEFSKNGESLEVRLPDLDHARLRTGRELWERFADFLPFSRIDPDLSLGEGSTPLVRAPGALRRYTGLENLYLKNETQNPTWSFKDRGSFSCVIMAREMGERVTATISTGNMGQSIAAYGAHSGLSVIVFVPVYTPVEKLKAMAIHGATVIRVAAPDYSVMKRCVLDLAHSLDLRIVSGNGPIRVEGYKLTAFEMYEQLDGQIPDYIAVPTSACGHIRGIHKGYRELREAGLSGAIPRMIVVQARNNSPIVSAIKQGVLHVIPVHVVHTIAEAITSGNPPGGDELVARANEDRWLAEDVTEDEILEGQRVLAGSGYFVEPAAAVSLPAVAKLRRAGALEADATVIVMLTGCGLKDMEVMRHHPGSVIETDITCVGEDVGKILNS